MPQLTPTEEVNTIRSTTDYGQFSFLHNNRDANLAHVTALKRAFTEFGNLTKAQPILVNESGEIIDGQHRFVVARELHQPVFYTVVPGLNIEDARQMNLLHMNWSTDDFAKSYAASGVTAYQQYLELREEFPEFAHSIILVYLYNEGNDTSGMYKAFREGDLIIEDLEATRQRLEILRSLKEKLIVTKAVARAIITMMKNPNFQLERLVRKLAQHEQLHPYSTVRDNLRALEDVYNYQISEANQVRFF